MSETIRSHRAITLLTQGQSNPFVAKTAISLARYRGQHVAAILDSQTEAKTSQSLFGTGGDIPVVADLGDVDSSDALYIGIAPPGGKLPEEWNEIILSAIERKLDIVSGLHDFLNQNRMFADAAEKSGSKLIDVRDNNFHEIASGQPFRPGNLRIHAVGQDCSIGKMVTMLEIDKGLKEQGKDSQFLATGQTGIMISGAGIPVDRVIADFVNGAAEKLVRENDEHDFSLIEGQGSVTHPAYSAVTLGLLHGSAPDGLIYCYEAGRELVKGLDGIPIPKMEQQMEAYTLMANLRHPCRFVGIAVNSRHLSEKEADREIEKIEEAFQLPACDVYRHGAQKLTDAVIKLKSDS